MKKIQQPLRKIENEKYKCPKCGGRTVKGESINGKKRRKCQDCNHQYTVEENVVQKTTRSEKIFMHAAIGFTQTLCGIDFGSVVPCRMTNSIDGVNCPDCITILKIKARNRKHED